MTDADKTPTRDSSPPVLIDTFPKVGQHLTLMSVLDGDISIVPAEVDALGENFRLEVHLTTGLSILKRWQLGMVLPLLFEHGDAMMHLRTSLLSKDPSGKLSLQALDKAKIGDRRAYRRGNAELKLLMKEAEGLDSQELRQKQQEEASLLDMTLLPFETVNLSGSGFSTGRSYFGKNGAAKKGDLLDVRILLKDHPGVLITAVAQVVRVKGDGGESMLAAHFLEISSAHQDLIIYEIFSLHFNHLGIE